MQEASAGSGGHDGACCYDGPEGCPATSLAGAVQLQYITATVTWPHSTHHEESNHRFGKKIGEIWDKFWGLKIFCV